MSKIFKNMAYTDVNDFVYGSSKSPVSLKNGLVIGGGQILPELNFTLPPMTITKETMPEVIRNYKEIIDGACKRAVELYVPSFVAEIEVLPPMTFNPEWGIEVTKVVREIMADYEAKNGLKSAVRLTPVDIREGKELKHMWHGEQWDKIMQLFEGGAKAGAQLLSIESVGGKEVHDDAIMFCDISKSLFALGILGARDMSKLWSSIVDIANRTGAVPAGDTACGFANTAMVLADRNYIPKVFSAVVRVMTAVRSLVAFEEGAIGPHKDCGYEGVYVKAITGTPVSLEGKSSACAHLSPVGNIAAAVADLWSNESVQNIKLLGGMAPTVSMEQLAYDCRLMNEATKKGHTLLMRDLLVDSDSYLDPQAYILRPDVVLKISRELVKEESHFLRTKKAAQLAVSEIKAGYEAKQLKLNDKELTWLDNIAYALDDITNDEEEFIKDSINDSDSTKFDPKKYNL